MKLELRKKYTIEDAGSKQFHRLGICGHLINNTGAINDTLFLLGRLDHHHDQFLMADNYIN